MLRCFDVDVVAAACHTRSSDAAMHAVLASLALYSKFRQDSSAIQNR